MSVGQRVQTCLTSVLERAPYTAQIAIWNKIAYTLYGARRKVLSDKCTGSSRRFLKEVFRWLENLMDSDQHY